MADATSMSILAWDHSVWEWAEMDLVVPGIQVGESYITSPNFCLLRMLIVVRLEGRGIVGAQSCHE